jgi:hypothetical protein
MNNSAKNGIDVVYWDTFPLKNFRTAGRRRLLALTTLKNLCVAFLNFISLRYTAPMAENVTKNARLHLSIVMA